MKPNKILFIILCFFSNSSFAAYFDKKYEDINAQSIQDRQLINITNNNFYWTKKFFNKSILKDIFLNNSYLNKLYLYISQKTNSISTEKINLIKNTYFFIKSKNKNSALITMNKRYLKKSNKKDYYLLISPYMINNQVEKVMRLDDYLLNSHLVSTKNEYHNKISSHDTIESILLDNNLQDVNKYTSENLSAKLSDRKNLAYNASNNVEKPVKIEQQTKNISPSNASIQKSKQGQPAQPIKLDSNQPVQPVKPVKLDSNQPQDLLKNPKFTDESELKEYQRNQALLEISNEQHAQFAQLITEANPKVVVVNSSQYSSPTITNKDKYDIDVSEIKNLENPMKRELDIEAAQQIMQQPIIIQAIINDKGMICYIDNGEFREGDHIGNETIKKISKDGIVVTNEQGIERKIDF